MEELIERLQTKAGLTPEQAVRAIETMKEYIQGQLPPMMQGMVDQFLAASSKDEDEIPGL